MKQDSTLQVLLVEDNEIDIEITRRIVERSDAPIDLTVARDGAEALALLFGDPQRAGAARGPLLPRLVMLDLSLPQVDGQEVLRRIKNHPDLCPVPVAILTGASGDRPLIECLRLGSNMYFVKPLSIADVTNLVSAVRQYWEVIEALQQRANDAKEARRVDPQT
jgi:CheY-like chemotaxis protein